MGDGYADTVSVAAKSYDKVSSSILIKVLSEKFIYNLVIFTNKLPNSITIV